MCRSLENILSKENRNSTFMKNELELPLQETTRCNPAPTARGEDIDG